MERAIKVISVEKGFDVRDYALVSFGGAGGLHACELAGRLSMKKVLVPKNAGVLSALGMTVADIVKDYSRSVLLKVKESGYRELVKLFNSLESKGMKDVLSEGIGKNRIKIENSVDMRYMGQAHELNLPFKKSFIDDFHKLHKRSYGYAKSDYSIEVVNIRVRVTGKTRKPVMEKRPKGSLSKEQSIGKKTKCFFGGKWLKADVFDRNRVQKRSRISGPALIVEDTSTTFLAQEYICNIDDYDNLIIEKRI